MIEKSRLEELIEQGATIYESDFFGVNAINVKKGDYVEQNGTLYTQEKAGCYNYFYNEQLFETKEEADWTVEFSCIERTERFEPLYYDNIDQNYCYDYHFWDKNHYGYTIRVSGKDIILFWRNCNHKEYYKNTKKEYEKLIRKCKELFLGE